jgi:hypothetical protein
LASGDSSAALRVDGIQVEQGAPKAADMVCARSDAETAPEPVSSAMKLLRLACALREISSADFCPSLPAEISARASPGRAAEGASETTGSTAAMG